MIWDSWQVQRQIHLSSSICPYSYSTVTPAEGVPLPEKAPANQLCSHLALNAASSPTVMPKSWYLFPFFLTSNMDAVDCGINLTQTEKL